MIIMDYYDLILAFIPVSFIGTAGTLAIGGIDLWIAVPIAAAIAIAGIGHALFVRTPSIENEPISISDTLPGSRPPNSGFNFSE